MRPRKRDRHLPPCVYFRHGAYWYVKRGRWTRLSADLRTAIGRYSALTAGPTSSMTELIDAALADALPRLAATTRKQYALAAGKLKRMLVEFAPEQVRPADVAQVKVKLRATPNMANRCLIVLRLTFDYALEHGIVAANPCTGIKRLTEAKRDRYLSDAELAAIRQAAPARLRLVIDLAYLTGQRIGDVLAIRRSDLTDDGIRFKQAKTGTGLTVAWSPALRATVEQAKALYPNLAAFTLLHNRHGRPLRYDATRKAWQAACAAAGVADAHIHDLRAKALTDTKRAGDDATALAGHSSAKMTDRYIRIRESPIVNGPSFGQLPEY